MEKDFCTAFLVSLCAAGMTMIGIATIRRYAQWSLTNATYFACFAAGVLISVSFLHIVPKAIGMSSNAPFYLLAGYLLMYSLNHFLTAFVCDRPATQAYAIGLIPIIGIGTHSLIDGVVYSVTFSIHPITGIMVAVGLVLHEFPEGIFTYVLLRKGGMHDRTAFLSAAVAAGLTTPIGTLVSFPIINRIDQTLLGSLLALSGGMLVYVGATHLLPAAEREARRYSLLAIGAGVVIGLAIIIAHNHGS